MSNVIPNFDLTEMEYNKKEIEFSLRQWHMAMSEERGGGGRRKGGRKEGEGQGKCKVKLGG